jgi:hypothetical protein
LLRRRLNSKSRRSNCSRVDRRGVAIDEVFPGSHSSEGLLSERGRCAIELAWDVWAILIAGGNHRYFVKSGLRSFLNRFLQDAGAWSLWLLIIHAKESVSVMPKPAPASYCERKTTDNLDQALSGMLDALRKPLKMTATLKRRALKNKAAGKSTLVEVNPATEVLKGR